MRPFPLVCCWLIIIHSVDCTILTSVSSSISRFDTLNSRELLVNAPLSYHFAYRSRRPPAYLDRMQKRARQRQPFIMATAHGGSSFPSDQRPDIPKLSHRSEDVCKIIHDYLTESSSFSTADVVDLTSNPSLLDCLTSRIISSTTFDLHAAVSSYFQSTSGVNIDSLLMFIERVADAGKLGLLRLALNAAKSNGLDCSGSEAANRFGQAFISAVKTKRYYIAAKLRAHCPAIDALLLLCPKGQTDLTTIFDTVRFRLLTNTEAIECAESIEADSGDHLSPQSWAAQQIRELASEFGINGDSRISHTTLPEPFQDFVENAADWPNPLHFACVAGDAALIDLLLERQSSPTQSFNPFKNWLSDKRPVAKLAQIILQREQRSKLSRHDRMDIANIIAFTGVLPDEKAIRLAIENDHFDVAAKLLASAAAKFTPKQIEQIYWMAINRHATQLVRLMILKLNQPFCVESARIVLAHAVRYSTAQKVAKWVELVSATTRTRDSTTLIDYLPDNLLFRIVQNDDATESLAIMQLFLLRLGVNPRLASVGGWAALRMAAARGADYYMIVVLLISRLAVDAVALQRVALNSVTDSGGNFDVLTLLMADFGPDSKGSFTLTQLVLGAVSQGNWDAVIALAAHPSLSIAELNQVLDAFRMNDTADTDGQAFGARGAILKRLRAELGRQFDCDKPPSSDANNNDDGNGVGNSVDEYKAMIKHLESCLRLPPNSI